MFGATRSQSGSGDTDFKFTGEQRDADSEMYFLRARYYDPETGRFLAQDPLPGGNLYAYVGNNPVNFVDPSGLCIPEINCPPGLGGGTQPPALPKSKDGSSFVDLRDACVDQYQFCRIGIKGGTVQLCAFNVDAEIIACQRLRRANSPLVNRVASGTQDVAEGVLEALTSDCAQGIAALTAAILITGVALYSGGALIAAGGLLTAGAGATATSGAAVGAAAFGPVPSETLTQLGGFAVGGVQGTLSCAR